MDNELSRFLDKNNIHELILFFTLEVIIYYNINYVTNYINNNSK